MSAKSLRAIVGTLAVALLAMHCPRFEPSQSPEDPMLYLDWLDRITGQIVELMPGVPAILPGPDGQLGTEDDRVRPLVLGDADLVVRSGMTSFAGAIPDPRALTGGLPAGRAEPFGEGLPIPLLVIATDGDAAAPYGQPVAPDYFDGLPILVLAFGDLDGDGFIGITLLDGDATDRELEEAELDPIGRRFVIAGPGSAAGQLFVEAGGPASARLRVALTAATWAGPADPDFLSGQIPLGPAVMTHLPFLPETDPFEILGGGAAGPPGPTSPDDLVGVEVGERLVPDPSRPYGEAFTLRLDGSDPTIDVATMGSGLHERTGLGRTPDPLRFAALPGRPLRPGLDETGARAIWEMLPSLRVADDGAESEERVRVLPLDRLGNVADPGGAYSVTLSTGGVVAIVSPDLDGDPFGETLLVADARGVEIVLDDTGGRYDDPGFDFLLLDDGDGLARVDLYLPDPDVDDSGSVDAADTALVEAAVALDLIDPSLDLDGDGDVSEEDAGLVRAQEGLAVPVP